jgi:hypothetical protein
MANCVTCGDNFPLARFNLGYRKCLECGDVDARQVRWTVTIPYSKGAYQVVNPADLRGTNPKRSAE